jgi:UDP-glucose 4-epimerase
MLHDLKPVRDYCHVDDFARAVVRACALAPASTVRRYNVGTMQGTSVRALVALILDALGVDIPVASSPGADRPRTGDIFRLVADNTRAASELGWVPSISLAEGIRMLVGIP